MNTEAMKLLQQIADFEEANDGDDMPIGDLSADDLTNLTDLYTNGLAETYDGDKCYTTALGRAALAEATQL